MSDKICPIMAQGFLANPHQGIIKNSIDAVKKLPKCLKEDCELWLKENRMGQAGYCGLIKPRK